MTGTGIDFQIRHDDLHATRVRRPRVAPVPEAGQILLRVDRFALTANNITYARLGKPMGYWQFFPADRGWSRLPVWGFADVERSRHPDIPEGERLYGCLPTSRHWLLTPRRVADESLMDTRPERTALTDFYSIYARVRADPSYRYAFEDQQMLLRPLFATAALLDDQLAAEGIFGARQVILSSASSKTATALAFLLRSGRRDCRVVGLTSRPHRRFVQSTGCFDEVVEYTQLERLSPGVPSVLIDFAGGAGLLTRIHEHFQEALLHSCQVGATQRDASSPPQDLPGARPVFFFAPEHVRRRVAQEGQAGFARWIDAAWLRFIEASAAWLRIEHRSAATELTAGYESALAGDTDPATGLIYAFEP